MKKFLVILAIVVALAGCKAPESVQKADVEALQAQVIVVTNLNTLVTRCVTAYREEAYKRIELFLEVESSKNDLNVDQKQALKKALEQKVDEEVLGVIQKFLEIKSQWGLSLELRQSVSEYLETQAKIVKIYEEFKQKVKEFK